MTVSANVSALQSYQTLMANSANNVANVNTNGFVPQNGTTQAGPGNSVTAQLTPATDNGSANSQTNLAKEMTDQMTFQRATEANVAALRSQNQMYGALLDIKV